MFKTMIDRNNMIRFVDVNDEPLHKELLKNQYIRLYVAKIPPSMQTLYHRHSLNTIYAVIQGGIIGTQIAGDLKGYPMIFPKSFSFLSKVRWGIRNLLTGSIKMPKGFFFSLPHKSKPIIHRATASKNNINDIIMVGVELKEKSNHNNVINLDKKFYKKDYECEEFFVYRLNLRVGQSTGFHNYNFPGLTIVFNSASCISIKDSNSLQVGNIELKCGDFHWHNCNATQSILNISDKNFEAIIIALK